MKVVETFLVYLLRNTIKQTGKMPKYVSIFPNYEKIEIILKIAKPQLKLFCDLALSWTLRFDH